MEAMNPGKLKGPADETAQALDVLRKIGMTKNIQL